MSSAKPPEFFLDRSLGRITANHLRDCGYVIHLIADHYPEDAKDVPDAEWITEGCARGWILLTKDQRIRYRTDELAALTNGHLFCLASGNVNLATMSEAFKAAMPRIIRAATTHEVGFWHVYVDGQIKRMWP